MLGDQTRHHDVCTWGLANGKDQTVCMVREREELGLGVGDFVYIYIHRRLIVTYGIGD